MMDEHLARLIRVFSLQLFSILISSASSLALIVQCQQGRLRVSGTSLAAATKSNPIEAIEHFRLHNQMRGLGLV